MTVVEGWFQGKRMRTIPAPGDIDDAARQEIILNICLNSKAFYTIDQGRFEFVGNRTDCALLVLCQRDWGVSYDEACSLACMSTRCIFVSATGASHMMRLAPVHACLHIFCLMLPASATGASHMTRLAPAHACLHVVSLARALPARLGRFAVRPMHAC